MVCDDHLAVLEGVIEILKKFHDFEIIGKATNGQECIALFDDGISPDIILLDIQMSSGISGYDVARYIQKERLPIKVIALSMLSDIEVVKAMIRCGALGFIFKGESLTNIDIVIRQVHNGLGVYPEKCGFDQNQIEHIKNTPIPWLENITNREILAIQLIGSDKPTKQVANEMKITESVVNKKIANVLFKTGVRSKLGIIQFFKKVGILE